MGNPRQLHPRRRWAVALVAGVVAIALIGIISYTAFHPDTIHRGVTVSGIAVADLSREQAKATVVSWLDEQDKATVTVRYGDFQREASLKDLNLRPNVDAAVDAAYGVGRQGWLLENVVAVVTSVISGREISLSDYTDREGVREAARQLAKDIDQQPVDGQFKLDNATIVTTPPQAGRHLDVEATADRLLALLRRNPSRSVDLAVIENVRPDIDEPQLLEATTRAKRLLDTPLSLRFDQRSWEMPPERISELLAVEKTAVNGKAALAVNVDGQRTEALLKGIAQDIDQQVVNAKWQFTGTQVEVTAESQEGRNLDITSAVALVTKAIEEDGREVALPVQKTRPELSSDDIRGWGIKELVASTTTDYFSGKERMHNIELAMSRLDGTLIPKGAKFSLNNALGDVSTETGYQTAYVIVTGQTVPGMGGGLCQVATTLFQSVFWGGYRIVERYPHEYHMPRYESKQGGVTYKGLDATIDPGVDFVFENNGPSALILKASTDGQNCYLSLYGTKPDWQVSISNYTIKNERPSPRQVIHQVNADMAPGAEVQVEKATDGFDSYITRVVSQGQSKLDEYTVASSYLATNDVFLSAPGAPAQPAAPAPDSTPSGAPTPTAAANPTPEPTPSADR